MRGMMKTRMESARSGILSQRPELIVQVVPCYVDLEKETGGVANIVRQICLKLADMHRQTLLLCGNTELCKTVAEPGFRRASEDLAAQVFSQRRHPLLGPTAALRRRIQALPRHTILHVHTCFSAFTEAAMRCAARNGIPYIFTPHGKLSREFLRNKKALKMLWWKLVARTCVAKASEIALSSGAESALFSELGISDRLTVIPNGFEPFSQDFEERDASEIALPYVLFLGYLDPRKQPEFLVRMFAHSRLAQTHALVFAGPDSYGHRAVIEAEVTAAGLEKMVIFTGPVSGRRKWNLLSNATCLCLPSRAEGLPVILCEAIGAGLPVLFSEACNFADLADKGAGIELKGFDVSVWRNALEKICLSRETQARMHAAARRLSSQYTWRNIAERWITLYDAVWRAS